MTDVAVIGAGLLGRTVAEFVRDLPQVSTVLVADPDPVDPTVYPRSGVASTNAGALVQCLRPRAPGRPQVRLLSHWSDLEHERPSLTVVTSSRLEPDRALTELLVRRDLPHLIARLDQDTARIGPMVTPGQTPCLNCLDLVQAGADPQWRNSLIAACASLAPRPEPLATWLGATTTIQVAAQLRHGVCDAVGCTIELGSDDLLTRVRQWPVHPECGCCWWDA